MRKLSLDTRVFLLGVLQVLFLALLIRVLHSGHLQRTPAGVGLLALGMLTTLGFFVWFIHHYVTRRVCNMARTVSCLTEGDDGCTRLPILHNDEIGMLAEQFNLLIDRNWQMTANLEHLVAARTNELQQTNQELLLMARVFEHAPVSIVITDPKGVILQANPAFEVVTGFPRQEALGHKASLIKSDRHTPEFYQEMWARLTTEGSWQGEIWNRRKDGEIYPAMLSITSVRNEAGAITHYIGNLDDISLNKRNEERVYYLAFHDPLTGLANRVLFADRTGAALQRARRDGDQLAVIVLDLDGFKQVNDTLGHSSGDLLLIEIAKRLQNGLRGEDTVARFGGDEFTALLPQIDGPGDAVTVAEKLLATISTPLEISGHMVQVSASIGISIYPTHGEDYQALFTAADAAMYLVKTSGKSGCRLAVG